VAGYAVALHVMSYKFRNTEK